MIIELEDGLISKLNDRYGNSMISKPSLIMALHYHLKHQIHSCNSNISFIESKIEELVNKGYLIKKGRSFKIPA
jgi:hypothetical protein